MRRSLPEDESIPPRKVDAVFPGDEVETSMVFEGSPAQIWPTLLFYEQVVEKPPWHLRLILPVPLGTKGSKSQVGDEALCLYREGHLVKQVVRVEQERSYDFRIVEQELPIAGGTQLFGGSYSLREIVPGRTRVTVLTRYASRWRPRRLFRPLEAAVCHLFHRHILRAMRRGVPC